MASNYSYHLSRSARRYLARCQPEVQTRVAAHLELLCIDPFDTQYSAAMHGRHDGLRRSRVGQFRILFYVDEVVRILDVTDIGPRGDIYKGH